MRSPDREQLRSFLPRIPLFGGVADETVARVVAMFREHRLARGSTVCREGEFGHALYVVYAGEVVVTRNVAEHDRDVRVARLGPGEFFGEMTLIDPQPRSATVLVERDAVLYSLTNRDLYALYTDDVHGYVMVLQNICRELSRRLRRADERICEQAAAAGDDRTQIAMIPALR